MRVSMDRNGTWTRQTALTFISPGRTLRHGSIYLSAMGVLITTLPASPIYQGARRFSKSEVGLMKPVLFMRRLDEPSCLWSMAFSWPTPAWHSGGRTLWRQSLATHIALSWQSTTTGPPSSANPGQEIKEVMAWENGKVCLRKVGWIWAGQLSCAWGQSQAFIVPT